jgi:hypothetical protein
VINWGPIETKKTKNGGLTLVELMIAMESHPLPEHQRICICSKTSTTTKLTQELCKAFVPH